MRIHGVVRPGEYFDSVTLMTVSARLRALPGIIEASVVTGQNENRSILKAGGLWLPQFEKSTDADLLVVVSADSEANARHAIDSLSDILKHLRQPGPGTTSATPVTHSLRDGLRVLPDANLALISIAGRYAGDEAMKALNAGLHVMLFSDNVSIEKERELKERAIKKNLLVMGPDCGTAIVNGVPLAFANVVSRGNIGIVAAAGTGLQEVTTLISNHGGGVSQALGTGGRDVKKEVGGLMFLSCMDALLDDSQTKVILLVSKPPHEEVLAKILAKARQSRCPVVSVFLGADPKPLREAGIHACDTLEEGALLALSLSGVSLVPRSSIVPSRPTKGKYLRALYTGGTYTYEAQLILKGLPEIYSNVPAFGATALTNAMKSTGHTIIDLGEDEFTVGRPHPMIDFSLRNQRIVEESKNPETKLILLDVVLGYGSNMNPLDELRPVLKEATSRVPVWAFVCGTDRDPQSRQTVMSGLKEMGVQLFESNAHMIQSVKECV